MTGGLDCWYMKIVENQAVDNVVLLFLPLYFFQINGRENSCKNTLCVLIEMSLRMPLLLLIIYLHPHAHQDCEFFLNDVTLRIYFVLCCHSFRSGSHICCNCCFSTSLLQGRAVLWCCLFRVFLWKTCRLNLFWVFFYIQFLIESAHNC